MYGPTRSIFSESEVMRWAQMQNIYEIMPTSMQWFWPMVPVQFEKLILSGRDERSFPAGT